MLLCPLSLCKIVTSLEIYVDTIPAIQVPLGESRFARGRSVCARLLLDFGVVPSNYLSTALEYMHLADELRR